MQNENEMQSIIENKHIMEREKELLSFFLSQISDQKQEILNQINNSNVLQDCSPYYNILLFNQIDPQITKTVPAYCDLVIQVLHKNVGPTVFRLLITNGFVHEFEVYNADLRRLQYDKLIIGEVYKEF